MRFVDLSIAGMIAVSSVALLVVWNPQAPDIAARRNADEARLRDHLLVFVQKEGLVTLLQDPPAALCTMLNSESNSTVTYAASDEGTLCGGTPSSGAAKAELTIAVGQKVVVLEDWYAEGA